MPVPVEGVPDGQARRLATETSQAAETLKRWVEEAVGVQRRLAASLEQAPGVAQTHPPGSLRSLAQLADKGMQRSSALLSNNEPGIPGERVPEAVERPTLVHTVIVQPPFAERWPSG